MTYLVFSEVNCVHWEFHCTDAFFSSNKEHLVFKFITFARSVYDLFHDLSWISAKAALRVGIAVSRQQKEYNARECVADQVGSRHSLLL